MGQAAKGPLSRSLQHLRMKEADAYVHVFDSLTLVWRSC